MSDTWLTTTVAASLAGRSRETVRRLAASSDLGPLARQEQESRGPVWLVHPCLGDPAVYVALCPPGRWPKPGAGDEAVCRLAMRIIFEAPDGDMALWREAAEVVKAVRAGSPMTGHRLLRVAEKATRLGWMADAEALAVMNAVDTQSDGEE